MAQQTANRAQLGPSQAFCDGVYCSISANNSKETFCVYHKSVVYNAMYYRLGKVTKENVLAIGEEKELEHCSGKYPKVAINDDKMVVVAFTVESVFSSNIKYTVGSFKHKTSVRWATPSEACTGSNPSIAISGDTVILVYCNSSSDILYKLGQLSSSSMAINWTPEHVAANNARYPSVALNNAAFVLLYTDRYSSRLKTIVGEIKGCTAVVGEIQDDSERKTNSDDAYEGHYPAVCMFDDHSIIAAHERGGAAFRKLFIRSGKVNITKKVVKWNEARAGCLVPGAQSSVSVVNNNEKQFVEVHSTNRLGGCTLWYEVGSLK